MSTLGSGEGDAASPFEPPAAARLSPGFAGERAASPPLHPPGALMADRRTVEIHARVSPAERAAWRAKSAAVGVPLSDLLRQAMARTRTWTAAAAEVERERTRQVARIGNNLNQVARWANTNASGFEAVEVIVNLVDIARALRAVARVGGEVDDAR